MTVHSDSLSLGDCFAQNRQITNFWCYTVIMSSTDSFPEFSEGVQMCCPKNITTLVVDNEIYLSWDIKYFNTSGCPFLVTVWNCSSPDTPFLTCNLTASHQHVRRHSLNKCLGRSYSYHHGIVIDIKWNNKKCHKDNGCSYDIYIPKLTETG